MWFVGIILNFIIFLDLATICHSSNEFHFDNFPTQLHKLQKLIKQEKQNEENKWVESTIWYFSL